MLLTSAISQLACRRAAVDEVAQLQYPGGERTGAFRRSVLGQSCGSFVLGESAAKHRSARAPTGRALVAIDRNRWSSSTGNGGRLQPETPVAMDRCAHPDGRSDESPDRL
jgi:hypothetical protein